MNRTHRNQVSESGVCSQLGLFSSIDTETAMRFTYIGYIGLLFPFAIILNSFAIFLTLRFKHLRQTTFILALQVIIVNLAYTLLVIPISISSAQAGDWILGATFCRISAAAISFLYQMRNCLMFTLVCDRFCTIFFPLRYPKLRPMVVIPLYIGTILIAVVCVAIILGLDCITFHQLAWICLIEDGCTNTESCHTYRLITVAVATVIGSYIPMAMYIIIFIKARKIRNQTAPSGQAETEEMAERRKQERRANTTYFLLFLSLFGVTFVPILLFLTVPTNQIETQFPEAAVIGFALTSWTYYLLPIVDPISLMRNEDVRKALKKLRGELRAITNSTE